MLITDHVAMDFTNKPDLLFIWIGLLCIGAVPALINFNLTSKPLTHCITVADAKLFIFDSEIAANVQAIKGSLDEASIRSICLVDPSAVPDDLSWTETLQASTISSQPNTRPPDSLRQGPILTDMEMLLFTSGTTGLPKAAIISFNKLGSAPNMFTVWAEIKPSDRFYTCMPLYHATALILGAAMIVIGKATFVMGHKFSTQTFWEEVRSSRATCIQYVGEMCRYLVSAPETSRDKDHRVRMAFGNGMRPDVWNRFRHRFGVDTIAELYAATGIPIPFSVWSDGLIGRGQWSPVELQFRRLWRRVYWKNGPHSPTNDQQNLRHRKNGSHLRRTHPRFQRSLHKGSAPYPCNANGRPPAAR